MCGIFGHISLTTKKRFNPSLFCTLGINNDSRGGDSCGIFIDGKSEYGTTKETVLFSDFFLKSELLEDTKEFNIALGHCRKASPGMGISPEKAQPVILTGKESKEVKFVLIHNGTIHNYEDLAKKYIPKVDIKGLTDSQVMARIFYYKGYDVLSEYRGGSVFVIVDYREEEGPKVLLFKGASKKYDTPHSVVTEERPLFISVGKSDLVFSSIDTFIPAFRPKIEVQTITENNLIEYKDNNLWVIKEYDRSKTCQAKQYVSSAQTIYYGSGYPGNYEVPTTGSRTFVMYNDKFNTYTSQGKPLHGQKHLERYGWARAVPDKTTREIWFFNGVPMREKECYRILEEYFKKTKLPLEDFFQKAQNLIRYLSLDQLYFKNGKLVQATNVYSYTLFSGMLIPLMESYKYSYKNGVLQERIYEFRSEKEFKSVGITSGKSIDTKKLRKRLC